MSVPPGGVDDDRDTAIEVQTNFCFITNLLPRHDDHKRVAFVFPIFFQYFSIVVLCCGTSVRSGKGKPPLPVRCSCRQETPTLTQRNTARVGKEKPTLTLVS